ncbi:MAG: Na+/H+ antiporter NhaA, partial [Muribaculaceae bacterium]|nr:Na+/H+ antiporter NhaA [Muribaculaceae bacterium]
KLTRRSILSPTQMDMLKQIESASDKVISPLQDLEDSLHAIVNYLIVPLFAFANAGIYLLDMSPADAFQGVSASIIIALVAGKLAGIFLFSWGAVSLRIAPMPEATNWKMILGVSALGGIGFTVSLFIANLSFSPATPDGAQLLNLSKLGIVIGSLVSGLGGMALLWAFLPRSTKRRRKAVAARQASASSTRNTTDHTS